MVKQRSVLKIFFDFLSKIEMTPTCYGPALVRNLIFSFEDYNDIIVGFNTNNFMYDKHM